MFETTIYTDVLASESVTGQDGFNFQAVSPGINGSDQRTITEYMLHATSRRWPLDADPLGHPETFAHIVEDGKHYISRGKSTGDTNTGRRGNQLTQTVVVPFDDYDLMEHGVPAQLFFSSHWALTKNPSKEAPCWSDTGLPDSEDLFARNDATLDWVKNTPWIAEKLPNLISVLSKLFDEGRPSSKIVVIYQDLQDFVRCVELASLMLDSDKPMSLEFKSAADSPWNTRGQIIGIPSVFSDTDLSDAFIINFVNNTMSSAEVDTVSATTANWFLHQDLEDAQTKNDVLRRWSSIMDDKLAIWATCVATNEMKGTDGFGWQGCLKVLEALSQAGLSDDLESYSSDFLVAIESSIFSTEGDYTQAAQTALTLAASGQNELAFTILKASFANLQYSPQHISDWAKPLLSSPQWDWVQGEENREYCAHQLLTMVKGPEGTNLEHAPALFELLAPLKTYLTQQNPDIVREREIELALQHRDIAPSFASWIYAEEVAYAIMEEIVLGIEENYAIWSGGNLEQLFPGGSTLTELPYEMQQQLLQFTQRVQGSEQLVQRFSALQSSLHATAQTPAERIGLLGSFPSQYRYLALAGTSPSSHPKLWGAWLHHFGLSPKALVCSLTALTEDLQTASPATKKIYKWQPLVDELSRQSSDTAIQEVISLYQSKIDGIDTLGKKITGFFGIGNSKNSKPDEHYNANHRVKEQ